MDNHTYFKKYFRREGLKLDPDKKEYMDRVILACYTLAKENNDPLFEKVIEARNQYRYCRNELIESYLELAFKQVDSAMVEEGKKEEK